MSMNIQSKKKPGKPANRGSVAVDSLVFGRPIPKQVEPVEDARKKLKNSLRPSPQSPFKDKFDPKPDVAVGILLFGKSEKDALDIAQGEEKTLEKAVDIFGESEIGPGTPPKALEAKEHQPKNPPRPASAENSSRPSSAVQQRPITRPVSSSLEPLAASLLSLCRLDLELAESILPICPIFTLRELQWSAKPLGSIADSNSVDRKINRVEFLNCLRASHQRTISRSGLTWESIREISDSAGLDLVSLILGSCTRSFSQSQTVLSPILAAPVSRIAAVLTSPPFNFHIHDVENFLHSTTAKDFHIDIFRASSTTPQTQQTALLLHFAFCSKFETAWDCFSFFDSEKRGRLEQKAFEEKVERLIEVGESNLFDRIARGRNFIVPGDFLHFWNDPYIVLGAPKFPAQYSSEWLAALVRMMPDWEKKLRLRESVARFIEIDGMPIFSAGAIKFLVHSELLSLLPDDVEGAVSVLRRVVQTTRPIAEQWSLKLQELRDALGEGENVEPLAKNEIESAIQNLRNGLFDNRRPVIACTRISETVIQGLVNTIPLELRPQPTFSSRSGEIVTHADQSEIDTAAAAELAAVAWSGCISVSRVISRSSKQSDTRVLPPPGDWLPATAFVPLDKTAIHKSIIIRVYNALIKFSDICRSRGFIVGSIRPEDLFIHNCGKQCFDCIEIHRFRVAEEGDVSDSMIRTFLLSWFLPNSQGDLSLSQETKICQALGITSFADHAGSLSSVVATLCGFQAPQTPQMEPRTSLDQSQGIFSSAMLNWSSSIAQVLESIDPETQSEEFLSLVSLVEKSAKFHVLPAVVSAIRCSKFGPPGCTARAVKLLREWHVSSSAELRNSESCHSLRPLLLSLVDSCYPFLSPPSDTANSVYPILQDLLHQTKASYQFLLIAFDENRWADAVLRRPWKHEEFLFFRDAGFWQWVGEELRGRVAVSRKKPASESKSSALSRKPDNKENRSPPSPPSVEDLLQILNLGLDLASDFDEPLGPSVDPATLAVLAQQNSECSPLAARLLVADSSSLATFIFSDMIKSGNRGTGWVAVREAASRKIFKLREFLDPVALAVLESIRGS